jgi:hypothetical protein
VKPRPTLDSATLRTLAKREVALFQNQVSAFVANVAAESGGNSPAVQYFFHEGFRQLSDLEQVVSACSEGELEDLRSVGAALLAMVSDVDDANDRAEGVYQLVGQYVHRVNSLGLIERRHRGSWVTGGDVANGDDRSRPSQRHLSYAA